MVGVLLACLGSVVGATERVTLPVREGDNVSMMLAMSGVSQGFLMELISSEEIAARLEAVRAGNTLELELDEGEVIALWLYDNPEGSAFRARRRSDGTWQPRSTRLSESALIASQVRQREALGLAARAELVREHGETRLSAAVIAAEIALHGKVNARRQPRVARAAPQRQPTPSRPAQQAKPVPAAPPATPSKPATPPSKVDVAQPAPTTSSQQVEPPSQSDPALDAVATSPAPVPTPPPAPRIETAITEAPAPEVSAPAASTGERPVSAVLANDTPALDAPARIEPAPRENTLASVQPSDVDITRDPSADVDAVAATIPLNCPGIEGEWRASYTNFDCEAEVSFTAASPGVYKMAQVGCGDIDGTVAQDGRKLSGEWEHAICDGVLTLQLDASCDTGTGTWQANAGKALCSVKRYPVVITRGLGVDAKPRKKLKLFSGPSKEAAAVEDEAAGDP